MTLRGQLTVVYTLASALLVTVVGVIVVIALRAGLTGNLDASLRARASDVSSQAHGDGGPVAVEAVDGIVVQVLGSSGEVVDGSDSVGTRPLATAAQLRRAQRAPVLADRTISGPDGERSFRVLVERTDPQRTLIVAADLSAVDDQVRRTKWLLVALSAVLVGAAALGSWLQARAALRVVDHMRIEAHDMTVSGARHGMAVPGSGDELTRLATTFNDLLLRLHTALEREREFAADAGHELRTPLTVMRGELELGAQPGRTPEQLRATIATTRRQAERLIMLAEGLLHLAKADRVVATPFELRQLVAECVGLCDREARQHDVSVVVTGGLPVPAIGDEGALHRVIVNLIVNAIRYAPAGSTVDVSIESTQTHWQVTVGDLGPGFPAHFLDRAFDRFSQADPSRTGRNRAGAGLGLAIVAAVMTAHGGEATAANRSGGGAQVSVRWPRRPVTSS